jgi:hypothetical protein
MAAKRNKNPSRSILQVITSLSNDSHSPYSEHTTLPLSYAVNTPTQASTQRVSTHPKFAFSSPQPYILTIPEVNTILWKS